MKILSKLILILPMGLTYCCKNSDNRVLQSANETIEQAAAFKAVSYAPRISESWHKRFQSSIEVNKNINEAWALFSYGGWADDGQIMIYKTNDKTWLEYAKPGTSAKKAESLPRLDLKVDPSTLNVHNNLKNIEETVFDSLNYEYVYINNSDPTKNAHVFMQVGDYSKYKDHVKLVSSFKSFNKLKD